MFKCKTCGHIFDEGEEKIATEDFGIFGGMRMIELNACCPICDSEYIEEACRCVKCKGVFLEEEIEEGLCEECIDTIVEEYKYNPEKCFELAKNETETIELNSFLCSMLTVEQMNDILLKSLIEQDILIDCTAFINDDKSWFLSCAKGEEVI